MTVPCLAQDPQAPPKGTEAPGTIDSAVQSIKRGAQGAGEAIKDQYNKARTSIHNMGVSSRVYGRLHWDKALNGSKVDIDVKEDGVATLTGVVPDLKAKAKAVDLTRDTVGVTQVIDQLTITPPPTVTPTVPPVEKP